MPQKKADTAAATSAPKAAPSTTQDTSAQTANGGAAALSRRHPDCGRAHITMLWDRLRANEIEPRLVDGTADGAKLILHARVEGVRRILDEGARPCNWTCYHYMCGGVMFCKVGVYDERIADFAYRSNAGAPPNAGFERERGAATDAFKRAARMWGIGDELVLPDIVVPIAVCDTYGTGDDRRIKAKAFAVEEITYSSSGAPIHLVLRSQSGKVFTWDAQT